MRVLLCRKICKSEFYIHTHRFSGWTKLAFGISLHTSYEWNTWLIAAANLFKHDFWNKSFFFFPLSHKQQKHEVNQCIQTTHTICILDFSFVCIVFKVCIFIQFSFCLASDGSVRNAFADFLTKAIILAGGHALKPSTLRKLLVIFCDLGCSITN